MSGQLPEGWSEASLDQAIETIESGTRPKGGASEDGGDIPSLGGENILTDGGFRFEAVRRVSAEFFDEMSKGHLRDRDVLINKDGANTGKVGFYINSPFPDACINEHLFLLRGKPAKLDQGFLYYFLLSSAGSKLVASKITGSAQPGLGTSFIRAFPMLLPPLAEQEKIAEILGSIEGAIVATRRVIEQTRNLKRALMQELLTRGIPGHHTHFKGSPLGQIPADWSVISLSRPAVQLIDGDRGKNYPKQSDFTDNRECLFLTAKNVTANGFDFSDNIFITARLDHLLGNGKLSRGDLVITTRGTVGNIALYDSTVPYDSVRINSGMLIIRTLDPRISNEFLYTVLRSQIAESQIRKLAFGSAQPQLTVKIVSDLWIPLPHPSEQEEIVGTIAAVEARTNSELSFLTTLQSTQHCLSAQLLSGKIRVPLATDVPTSAATA